MSKTIALHLGAHKTATTTLQREFAARRRELLRLGVAYLGRGQICEVAGLIFPNPSLPPKIVQQVQKRTAGCLEALIATALGDSYKRILVSEENIIGTPQLILRSCMLYPGLRTRLGALPESWNTGRTHVFLSIRNYASFFASCHSTAARRGLWLPFGPSERASVLRMPRRWPDVVAEIQETLPKAKLTIWRYEDLHDVGNKVLHAMVGERFDVNFGARTSMQAPSAGAMSEIEAIARQNVGKKLAQEMIKQLLHEAEGSVRYDPWDSEDCGRLSKLYVNDCATLAEMCGVEMIVCSSSDMD